MTAKEILLMSIQSRLVYGYIGMVDYIIEKDESKVERKEGDEEIQGCSNRRVSLI